MFLKKIRVQKYQEIELVYTKYVFKFITEWVPTSTQNVTRHASVSIEDLRWSYS